MASAIHSAGIHAAGSTIPPVFSRLVTSLFTALMLAAAPAWAEVSRDGAAAAAQQVTGGRVLSVERAGAAWRVKVVTASGEVRVVMINAATGRPM